MAEESQDSNWPLPKFYFSVDWGHLTNVPFQEVSGLEIEGQAPEYRHGNSPVLPNTKMPGIIKNSQATMKKGVFVNDNTFWDWYNKIKTNNIGRQDIVIKLMDESGSPTMIWTLSNAWPTKITSTDLKADVNKVAVETIEISHEGITIAQS